MRIFHLPLEPYPERYTELLTKWTRDRWCEKPNTELITIYGPTARAPENIKVGVVLDAFGRCRYSLQQMANLVDYLSYEDTDRENDVIYVEDMFTPGLEALPYIYDQLSPRARPRVYVRNYAQSMDPDDFTHKMREWMRHYERLIYEVVDGVLCASSVHAEMMAIAGLPMHHVHVVGLPFDRDHVRSFAPTPPPMHKRNKRVIYSSRLDIEKQPHFFLDIVERMHAVAEFVICTGAKDLRSNDPSVIKRIEDLENKKRLFVERGANKQRYYSLLASSRVQLNTARQDFISFTAIEASCFGTHTLAPAFRSFPEALRNSPRNLFVPWSVDDAVEKLSKLLNWELNADSWLADTQHATLDRTYALFMADQERRISNIKPWWETT